MKTFSQLNEDSVNDRLDKLGHPKKLNSKRLKQLTLKYPAYEDIDLEQWQGYPFPRNSSVQAFNELKYLQQLAQNRTSWQEEMVEYDLKIVEPFKEYLDEYGIEVDWNRIEDLVKQSHPIILSLKRYYNRPRPNRLGSTTRS